MKEYVPVKNRRTAIKRCPWASKIVKDEWGFWCFESEYDYLVHQTTYENEKKEGKAQ